MAAGSAILVLTLAWAAGFVWFIAQTRLATPVETADAIVVLTGGAERVEVALRLLVEGRGKRLLISGTGGGAELRDFAGRTGLDAQAVADRVTLGYTATTTHGNALETAAWVQENHIGSLIVVTAYYHMPRAMLELSRTIRGTRLFAYPVLRSERNGLSRGVAARLLVEEYCKYLIVAAGVTGWTSSRGGRAT